MGFVIYNASAGSGKTFTLVRHYLKIILDPKHPDYTFEQMLVITFTNAAAAELKARIVKFLQEIAYTEPENAPQISQMLCSDLVLPPEKLQLRAQVVLKKILHRYSSFNISTIDSFNHKLIRSFSKDLGLSYNFDVSLEFADILQRCTISTLDNLKHQSSILPMLLRYIKSRIHDNKSWNVSKDVMETVKNLLEKEIHHKNFKTISLYSTEDFIEFEKELSGKKQQLIQKLKNIQKNFFEIIQKHDLERNHFNRGYCYDFFKNLHVKTPNFVAKWIVNFNDTPPYSKTQKQHIKTILDSVKPYISSLIRQSKICYEQLSILENIHEQNNLTAITNVVQHTLDKYREEENTLFVADFNKRISEVIADQPVPFIYERLGERFRYYFIDEFQDTSQMQWKNIIPLIGDAIESIGKNDNPGELYLVGDAKQSIYRFRGGEPEQFIDLYNHRDRPFQVDAKSKRLEYNYRSCEEIINFNNRFFKFISHYFETHSYGDLYEHASQNTPENKTKNELEGYVSIDFIEGDKKEDFEDLSVSRITEIIFSLKAQGHRLSDICILVDKHTQATVLANYFQSLEDPISVISSEALSICKHPDIQLLESVLNWIQSPYEKAYKWGLALNICLIDSDVPSHSDIECVMGNVDKFLKNHYGFHRNTTSKKTLYDTTLNIVCSFDLKWTNYLQDFLNLVFNFQRRNIRNSLEEFLKYWNEKKDTIKVATPQSDNAINIMTVHKSKGLEFPTVIYFSGNKYDIGNKSSRESEYIWYDLDDFDTPLPQGLIKAPEKSQLYIYPEAIRKKQEETLRKRVFDQVNKLYVALTRAENQLYVVSGMPSKDLSKKTFPNFFRNYLDHLKIRSDTESHYSFGKPSIKASKKTENDYTDDIYITLNCRASPDNPVAEDYSNKEMEKGILIHELLETIYVKEDIDITIDRYAKKKFIPANIADLLSKTLYSIVVHPELAPYFSRAYKVYNERSVLTEEGEVLRLDKLIIRDQTAVIIDFKTGRPKRQNITQINKYSDVVKTMGYRVINKFLVYIGENIDVQRI